MHREPGRDERLNRNFPRFGIGMKSFLLGAMTSLLCLTFSPVVTAGSFNVKPTRIFLDVSRPTGVLRIQNISERPLSLQLNAVEWTQDAEGNDKEIKSTEVVFFPKLFSLSKGGTRLIRVGLLNQKPGARQKTYRIYIRELPVDTKEVVSTLKILLRVGVPVFLAPRVVKVSGAIDGLGVQGAKVSFTAENSGTVDLRLQKVSISAVDEKGKEIHSDEVSGWYLLSGAKRRFKFDLSPDVCRRVRKIAVHILSDKLQIDSEARVSSGACKTQ